MSETLATPNLPEGEEVRNAYAEITNYNGRNIFRSVARFEGMSPLAVNTEDISRPDEECVEVLNAIGLGVHKDDAGNGSFGEYRPTLQDTDTFVKYIHTIDTDIFDEDTTELQLIGAVLRNMVTKIHINEEILASFEKIDEALDAKGLNPPAVYEAVLETEPEFRFNEARKRYLEAESYVNPYAELVECVMARHENSLHFHFNQD